MKKISLVPVLFVDLEVKNWIRTDAANLVVGESVRFEWIGYPDAFVEITKLSDNLFRHEDLSNTKERDLDYSIQVFLENRPDSEIRLGVGQVLCGYWTGADKATAHIFECRLISTEQQLGRVSDFKTRNNFQVKAIVADWKSKGYTVTGPLQNDSYEVPFYFALCGNLPMIEVSYHKGLDEDDNNPMPELDKDSRTCAWDAIKCMQ